MLLISLFTKLQSLKPRSSHFKAAFIDILLTFNSKVIPSDQPYFLSDQLIVEFSRIFDKLL